MSIAGEVSPDVSRSVSLSKTLPNLQEVQKADKAWEQKSRTEASMPDMPDGLSVVRPQEPRDLGKAEPEEVEPARCGLLRCRPITVRL